MTDENDLPNDHHDESSERPIPRRRFLRSVALASASTLLLPRFLRAGGHPASACDPTTADIEGPFYRAGAPFRVALATATEPGERLYIGGIVYANDCATPLPGVTVDVWAANNEGCYNNNVDCSPHSDDVYNLRGRMLTNEKGEYAFSTIKPGRYLNGGTYRPSHIHFRVTAPGADPLVTQLYFEGDPFISVDPWASEPEADARIIPLRTELDGLAGRFDITLGVQGQAAGYEEGIAAPTAAELFQNVPNPFSGETSIAYHVARQCRVDLAIYDMLGRRVRTLVSSVHGAGTYSERWDARDDSGRELPSGIYTCRLQAGAAVCSRKMVLGK